VLIILVLSTTIKEDFFYGGKNAHNSGKKFIPKLGSLSKTNVRTLDLMKMEFVNVIDNNIHIKKILPMKVGSIAKKM
jgi:hypothetical protein